MSYRDVLPACVPIEPNASEFVKLAKQFEHEALIVENISLELSRADSPTAPISGKFEQSHITEDQATRAKFCAAQVLAGTCRVYSYAVDPFEAEPIPALSRKKPHTE